ncbi:MAG: ATP-binding cassette domain-containing protein [Butyrivibrio sp.]|nr:ATP-binding cassette domain-containing protein [Butyrivibrio sp.]
MRLEKVKAGYGKNIIVGELSLDIKKGEIISVIGPNGGGKSTLLKTISGQLSMMGGTVYIGRDDIKRMPLKEMSKKISIVTTQRINPQYMTCLDVVLAGRHPYTDAVGRFRSEDLAAADNAISLMNLQKCKDKPFDALSDGQKQRSLIARAICQDPEYLIMDEPTSYLDIRYRIELMDVLRGLSEKGITVIMSIHELEHAFEISDRLLLIDDNGNAMCKFPAEVIGENLLKDLYRMNDDMYERVKGSLASYRFAADKNRDASPEQDKKERHSAYFLNKECEYYPCHKLPEEKFSCLFCYCPLYDIEDCGGNYTYTKKGAKNCKDCAFPHDRDNYAKVIKKLKEKMYGDN